MVRSGLRSIIEDHAGWSVVAEAADGKDAIAKAIATTPDVAILDHSLPLINGVQATRQIRLRIESEWSFESFYGGRLPDVQVLCLNDIVGYGVAHQLRH